MASTIAASSPLDPAPPAYLFPPSLAARLRAAGRDRLTVVVESLGAAPAVARALVEGAT